MSGGTSAGGGRREREASASTIEKRQLERDGFFIGMLEALPFVASFWLWGLLPAYGMHFAAVQFIFAAITYTRTGKYVRSAEHIHGERAADHRRLKAALEEQQTGRADDEAKAADSPPSSSASSSSPDLPPAAPAPPRRRLSGLRELEFSRVNPFLNKTWKITERERVYLAFATVTLVPFRFVMVVLSLVWCWAWAWLSVVGLDHRNKEPIAGWRRLVQYPIRWGARSICFWFGFLYVPTRGEPAPHDKAPIIVSNHLSFMEPVYLMSRFLASPIGAAEHLHIPFLGTCLRALQAIAVDRRSPSSRKDVVEEMKRRATTPNFSQTLIFPEGTTTNGTSLISFKLGAFIPGKPVQPCLVRYRNNSFDPSWVAAGPSQGQQILRLLATPVNHMEVEFMEPYVPSAKEKKDPALFARNVRAVMAERLGVVPTEHSFEDTILMKRAIADELPPDVGLLEFGRFRGHVKLDVKTLQRHLDKFVKMASATGRVREENFVREFSKSDSRFVRRLFHILDEDDTGEVDFRQYLLGLGLALDIDSPTALVHLAFRMFDTDQDGKVSVDDLKEVYEAVLGADGREEAFKSLNGVESVDAKAFERFALGDPRFVPAFGRHFFPEDQRTHQEHE